MVGVDNNGDCDDDDNDAAVVADNADNIDDDEPEFGVFRLDCKMFVDSSSISLAFDWIFFASMSRNTVL